MAWPEYARLRQGPALMLRVAIALLLLSTSVSAVAASKVEGFYRFGHEVNTVCNGNPEKCYWLVDTSAEVRDQLKQQVKDLEPYAPACVRLLAEISSQKADGFGADYDGSIRVLEFLGPCGKAETEAVTRIEDLNHRRWILRSVDGFELGDYARELGFEDDATPAKIPELDFGEQGFVSGNTGCNEIQGQARVVDNSLILANLATTAMACAGFAAELELRLQLIYRNPLEIRRDGKALILQSGDHRLEYERRDWVQ